MNQHSAAAMARRLGRRVQPFKRFEGPPSNRQEYVSRSTGQSLVSPGQGTTAVGELSQGLELRLRGLG